MAIWVAARMRGAPVPRRLVYVVDRRAVVDQVTIEAIRLREWVQSNSQFCNGRDDAAKVAELLRGKAKKERIDSVVELFVGERSIPEREEAAQRLEKLGFIAGNRKPDANLLRFLVATSSAEAKKAKKDKS